jgi:2-methylisocitrate lyase-like PEP mutase family enzyme
VPVNVLALRAGPSIGELASVGVRRVSTGSGLARAAYGAFVAAAEELRDSGTSGYAAGNLSSERSDAMLS